MDEGYIKLHRRLLGSYLWTLPPGQRCVALTILMMANWQDREWAVSGAVVQIKRGEFVTSVRKLAEAAGVSNSCVVRSLKVLKKGETICVKPEQQWTRISVVNFSKYNDRDEVGGTRALHSRVHERDSSVTVASDNRRREEGKKGRTGSLFPGFDFELVYQRYPKKTGKKPGLAKCRKLIKTQEDYDALKSAVGIMAKAWRGHDTTYCPHFSTFVSQERWKDDELPRPNGNHRPGDAAPPRRKVTAEDYE